MFSQYPKLFIFLSAIILALMLYQLSQTSTSTPIKEDQNSPLKSQKIKPYKQGTIDSH